MVRRRDRKRMGGIRIPPEFGPPVLDRSRDVLVRAHERGKVKRIVTRQRTIDEDATIRALRTPSPTVLRLATPDERKAMEVSSDVLKDAGISPGPVNELRFRDGTIARKVGETAVVTEPLRPVPRGTPVAAIIRPSGERLDPALLRLLRESRKRRKG